MCSLPQILPDHQIKNNQNSEQLSSFSRYFKLNIFSQYVATTELHCFSRFSCFSQLKILFFLYICYPFHVSCTVVGLNGTLVEAKMFQKSLQNVCILASTSDPYRHTTVQMANLAPDNTIRITAYRHQNCPSTINIFLSKLNESDIEKNS